MLHSTVTTSRSYTPVKLPDENMTYYWRVDAVDRKGSQTSAAAEWCFFVPELNRPVAPMGLSGQMSSDERSFTISWSSVTMNTDSTAIEDLAGYNIYRLLSVSTETVTAAAPLAFVGSGTLTWTDSTVQGGKFYFLLKAVDESGIESDISMIIDSLSPETLTLLSSDNEAVAELPGVAEVYSVSGDYDLMAILKLKDYDAIAQVVTEQMTRVPGIVRTNTISAFRVYSRADREAGFTLGA